MKYPNYIKQYYEAIQKKDIIVSKKIEKLYAKLVDDINNPKDNWIYDEAKANKPIDFIEKCVKISKGSKAGQPVKLILWERAFVSAIFGFVDKDSGFRKYKQVFLLVSRKNGKSFLCLCLMLYCLFEEMGTQCVCAANTLTQANKVIFEELQNIIKQNPALAKRIRKRKDDLYYADGLSTIFPVTNSPNTQDGLNVSYCLFDEAHSQKTRELYDVIYQSMSTRDQPLILTATTNGFVRGGCFDNFYEYYSKVVEGIFEDNSSIGFFYELDDPKEIDNQSCWIKCNPSLGELKKLSFLKDIYNQSKNDPSIKRTCYTKDFNIPMDENYSCDRYLEPEVILAGQKDFSLSEFAGSYCVLGLDLSLSTDLSCLTAIMQKRGSEILYVYQDYWLPDKTLEEHKRESPVYQTWVDSGYLHLCKDSARIKLSDVEIAIYDYMKVHKICCIDIGYDRYGSQYIVQNLTDNGYTVTQVGQGYSISNPMKILQGLFLENKIIFNNPITAWCISNCVIKYMEHNNWKPEKLKRAMRIDGVSSLLDALFVYEKNKNDFLNVIK